MIAVFLTLFSMSTVASNKTDKHYLPKLTLATPSLLITVMKKPTVINQNARTYHNSAQTFPTGPAPCSAQTAPRALRPSQRNTAPAVSSLDSPMTFGVLE